MRPDFLFATPSFSSGLARLVDLAGQFDSYNDNPSDKVADSTALFADWRIVGETLAAAAAEFVREERQEAIVGAEPS
jgi:hypothetical protein